jgi:hypothetical protein
MLVSKAYIWEVLDGRRRSSAAGRVLFMINISVIISNALALMHGFVGGVQFPSGRLIDFVQAGSAGASVMLFSLQLALCTADARFRRPVMGRLACVSRPMMALDAFAMLPFCLSLCGMPVPSICSTASDALDVFVGATAGCFFDSHLIAEST